MSGLRERLARFDRPLPPRPQLAPDADPLAGLLEAGAQWHGPPPTGFLRREYELEPVPSITAARRLAPELGPGDLLVLDTETTGLESGTGTLVFMVGLLRWSVSGVRVVQYILPEPAGEAAFLTAVAGELRSAGGLVSYNGRGFDLPRLRSRMRMHKMDDTVLELPHLDLLYLTRRLVRGWLPDARLKTVEEELLGESRSDDLPGEFAPEVFRCLQLEGRDTGLVAVLRHNAMDIESLPRLAALLCGVVLDEDWRDWPPSVAGEVGRLRLLQGDAAAALPALERGCEADEAAARRRAVATLAALRRRAGSFAAAASLWRDALDRDPRDLRARVELAKLLEHRLGNPAAALELVVETRQLTRLRGDADPALCERLDHRYRRLVRKTGSRV